MLFCTLVYFISIPSLNLSFFYHPRSFILLPKMPKLIDYPRTSYSGAWEVAEIVDDTGGKCALETCARKLNRKVSGSFKAIVGSAVKFGLLTSKREMLTTTTLFRRIKHAYDKQEELLFHREAFLTPPLFTQLCRKFRGRELPVAMLDVLLMREFEVEEINAQSVAKAFIDGTRMVGLLDEHNILADIDQLAARQPPKRELASPTPSPNIFRQVPGPASGTDETNDEPETSISKPLASRLAPPTADYQAPAKEPGAPLPAPRPAPPATVDAIANLFGLSEPTSAAPDPQVILSAELAKTPNRPAISGSTAPTLPAAPLSETLFRIELAGPGINTQLDVTDVADLALVRALLDKIERQLSR